MSAIRINYEVLKGWRLPAATTPIVVICYLAIAYTHPANNHWLYDGTFQWLNFLQFTLLDQMLIEFATYFILANLIRWYALMLGIQMFSPTIKGWLRYQLTFLPVMLTAYLFFNPATQTLRYLYHMIVQDDPGLYMEDYFYSLTMYVTYLLPVFMGGYIMLNYNLYRNYTQRESSTAAETFRLGKIEVTTNEGKSMLDINLVYYIEKVGRAYFAFDGTGKEYRLNRHLNDLESQLAKHAFFRVNRSALINIKYLKNYSFWENDKYVVRMNDGKEFTASRERIKTLKSAQ